MKIKAQKKILFTALARIQGIAEKSRIQPLTSNALFETNNGTLAVSSTNLKIGMKATYKEVEVIEEGRISLNARKIFEIIRELPEEEITLSEKENYWVEITCGKKLKFNIIGLPPEDFPMFVNEEKNGFVDWDRETFIKMINLTSFSISRDETKPNICGAFLENLENGSSRIVTTDGYRLSIVDEELMHLPTEGGFIIPFKAFIEIQKLLMEKEEEKTCLVFKDQASLKIKVGEVDLYIRLLDKTFPDYKIIIPEEGYQKEEIKIKKDVIKPTLKRMSIISQENDRPVVFSFSGNLLEIYTEDSELGNVKETMLIENEIKGTFSFCINSLYLLDVLNALNNDILLEINCEEENRPIIIKSIDKNEHLIYIIMPMIMD